KLICQSNSTHSFASALDRAMRALDEFHIGGLPTNLPQLRAIVSHPQVRGGDARTTLLLEHPELTSSNGAKPSSPSLSLLEQQSMALRNGKSSLQLHSAQPVAGLEVPSGQEGVESPMAGKIIEVPVQAGDSVEAGATLMVV